MKMIHTSFILGAIALATVASAQSVARFVGRDGDWFNPRNWSTGRVPDWNTDVVIGGHARVVVDPTRWNRPVVVRDVILRGAARLETLPGTTFLSRHEFITGNAKLIHRSSAAGSAGRGGSLIVTSYQGVDLNPSTQSHRDVILKTSATLSIGVGGAAPATARSFGPGHYATIFADDVEIGGRLEIKFHYGFRPVPGQTYQIITANRWASGEFRGLPEGAMVARHGDVGLFISYEGGDGNDVTLHARELSPMP